MAAQGKPQTDERLAVEVQYSRTEDLYYAWLAPSGWHWSYGETEDEAVRELCISLQRWLERCDTGQGAPR